MFVDIKLFFSVIIFIFLNIDDKLESKIILVEKCYFIKCIYVEVVNIYLDKVVRLKDFLEKNKLVGEEVGFFFFFVSIVFIFLLFLFLYCFIVFLRIKIDIYLERVGVK